MSPHSGTFVWYELLTSDSDAAQAFYRAVVGWSFKDSGMTDRHYAIISAGSAMVGGLMTIPKEVAAQGARPLWFGYIAVDDVDAMVTRVTASGGKLKRAPEDIPGVGRFAVVSDPQGAPFVLFKGIPPPTAPAPVAPHTPGHVGWHELLAVDQATAFPVYADWFGWTKDEGIDMGPMGIYQLFSIHGVQSGGFVTKGKHLPHPFWVFYINTDNITRAVERVKRAGGTVIMEPHEVPGGAWIIHCLDPQGAMFAMVGPKG